MFLKKTDKKISGRLELLDSIVSGILHFIDLRRGARDRTTFAGRTTQILRIVFILVRPRSIAIELLCSRRTTRP